MKIDNNIRYYTQPISNRTSFTSLFRLSSCKDSFGVERSTQNSTSSRDDLNYDELAEIAKNRFKKYEKINIMPMNGSDGTESYCIANSILKTFGESDSKKRIFPIIVSDIDNDIIENYGKKGIVALGKKDENLFGKNLSKYFDSTNMSELPDIARYPKDAKAYKLKPQFRENFKFETMDFMNRLKNIKDEGNSIILIRNCLAQSYTSWERSLLLSELDNIIHDNSLFVIGGYDRANIPDFVKELETYGFKEIGKNIFSKNITVYSKLAEPMIKQKNFFSDFIMKIKSSFKFKF